MRSEAWTDVVLIDLRNITDDRVLQFDVCIAGAGAAGITLASQLADAGISVGLLESGGVEFDALTQLLNEVENVGIPRLPAITRRLRYFGGTTNHWTGKCGRLDSMDMAARDWVPDSGWPITRQDLDPFYDLAEEVLDLGPLMSGPRLASHFDVPVTRIDESLVEFYSWQLSAPTRFGKKYRALTDSTSKVMVITYANVVDIQTNTSASHVEGLAIRTLNGRQATVKARYYVLACGGIENARLMLASNRVDPRGVGNGQDLVGRYFMEHLRSLQLIALEKDPYAIQRIYNTYQRDGRGYLLGLRLSEQVQSKERILNGAFFANYDVEEESATDAAARLTRDLAGGRWPADLFASARRIADGLEEVAVNARRKLFRAGSRNLSRDASVLVIETEQAPNRESRVGLSSQLDALGQPLAKVDWRMSELDRHSVLSTIRIVASQLWLSHRARVRLPEPMENALEQWGYNFQDVSHHMGTTRMAGHPAKGVVDKNCRVFGVDNLFISGSSVFPTGGHVNPTMTIVALALRLSDHLKRESRAAR